VRDSSANFRRRHPYNSSGARLEVALKKITFRIAVFALLLSGSLFAQSLTGIWQGTLLAPQAPGGESRIAIKVSTTSSKSLSVVMYGIDQAVPPITANAVSLEGSAVRISIIAIGVTFEGKLSDDGNAMTGSWQGTVPQQVIFRRATPATAWAIPEPPPPLKTMPADANPSFDVATIRPSQPDASGRNLGIDRSGRMNARNMSLAGLICFAYSIHPQQLRGMPEGLASQRFDIQAKPDTPGQPNDAQMRSMMQKLLVDRFMLASHREKKELTVYTITVAKSGPKLAKTTSTATLPNMSMRAPGRSSISNATIADFARHLQSTVPDRPVVDQSAIEGRYDFTLSWTPDESQFSDRQAFPAQPADPNAETFPDLFTAMQQQLGLKLESVKAQVAVLVIDHVERPSEN